MKRGLKGKNRYLKKNSKRFVASMKRGLKDPYHNPLLLEGSDASMKRGLKVIPQNLAY